MDDVWKRIDAELARRRKNWQWLATELGWTIQRMHNWKTRGVPVNVFPDIATALERSIDWVACRDPDLATTRHHAEDRPRGQESHWPFPRVSAARLRQLPLAELERIQGFMEATVLAWEALASDATKSHRR